MVPFSHRPWYAGCAQLGETRIRLRIATSRHESEAESMESEGTRGTCYSSGVLVGTPHRL